MKAWEHINLALLVIIPLASLVAVVWTVTLAKLGTYVPPVRARLITQRKMADGQWLLAIEWRGRRYKVVGSDDTWKHYRSNRTCRSRVMRAWLRQCWEELESIRIAPEEADALLDEIETEPEATVTTGTVIRLGDHA